MIIAFFHARQESEYALAMLASVRRHMDCPVVQLTDLETEALPLCETQRLPWGDNPMVTKMRHIAALGEGDFLVLDTDVIVQADLSPVFSLPFAVALTWRDGPIFDPYGIDLTKSMPINCGVMWTREPAFWRACIAWCRARPDIGWYADQLAVAAVARAFNVLRLHCDNFNYTPGTADEDVSGRFAVHYKGKRKPWMLTRREKEHGSYSLSHH